MYLDPEKFRLIRDAEGLQAVLDGTPRRVGRVARVFPRTTPDHYIGLQDPDGHEIGIVRDPEALDEGSRGVLQAELKALYFVPTILQVRTVTRAGAGSTWEVVTDDGARTFRTLGAEAMDYSETPAITITDENRKRYRIANHRELDHNSRRALKGVVPRRVLRSM